MSFNKSRHFLEIMSVIKSFNGKHIFLENIFYKKFKKIKFLKNIEVSQVNIDGDIKILNPVKISILGNEIEILC